MKTYVVLIRGINVGGKNRVPMAELRSYLETSGFTEVQTYIASGNVILRSDRGPEQVQTAVEAILSEHFTTDNQLIKVLVVTRGQLQALVDQKPTGFGERPDLYHSDVIFLMNIDIDQAMAVFSPREGVDTIWPGKAVVYSQRLSAERTKSRLNRIIGSVPYQSMTIRSWNTVVKLLALMPTD